MKAGDHMNYHSHDHRDDSALVIVDKESYDKLNNA